MEKSCIVSDKLSADAVIKQTRANGLLDRNYCIEQDENYVYIPLVRTVAGYATHDFRPRMDAPAKIRQGLARMGIKNRNSSHIRLGNSLIFKDKISTKIAREYTTQMMIDNIYIETGKILGVKRKPTLKLVFGKGCETKIRESGITYILDLQKDMFSPGNINTRSKMRYMDFTGLVVLDMFSGIGYFSLQVLKNSRPTNMIMCDINPDSIYYLKKNLIINRIQNPVTVFTGDSRVVLPLVRADYIIMGNFNSVHFLVPSLIRSQNGTRISMHYLATTGGLDKAVYDIIHMARKLGYVLTCTRSERVKSVGPNYLHINSIFTVIRIL